MNQEQAIKWAEDFKYKMANGIKTIKVTGGDNFHQQIKVNNRICLVCSKGYYYDLTMYNLRTKAGWDVEKPIDNNVCRTCRHWVDNHMADRNREFAIIDGNHYTIGSRVDVNSVAPYDSLQDILDRSTGKATGPLPKGHAGAKFAIRFNNGEVVLTDDLHHQGEIPAELRMLAAFWNNAEFIK